MRGGGRREAAEKHLLSVRTAMCHDASLWTHRMYARSCSLHVSAYLRQFGAQKYGHMHAGMHDVHAEIYLHVLDPQVRLRHHEVDVEVGLGVRLEALDHGGAPGEVWHKVSVHDIQVHLRSRAWRLSRSRSPSDPRDVG